MPRNNRSRSGPDLRKSRSPELGRKSEPITKTPLGVSYSTGRETTNPVQRWLGIREDTEVKATANLGDILNAKISGSIDLAKRSGALDFDLGSVGKGIGIKIGGKITLGPNGLPTSFEAELGASFAGIGGSISADSKGNAEISVKGSTGILSKEAKLARKSDGEIALSICQKVGIGVTLEACRTISRQKKDPQPVPVTPKPVPPKPPIKPANPKPKKPKPVPPKRRKKPLPKKPILKPKPVKPPKKPTPIKPKKPAPTPKPIKPIKPPRPVPTPKPIKPPRPVPTPKPAPASKIPRPAPAPIPAPKPAPVPIKTYEECYPEFGYLWMEPSRERYFREIHILNGDFPNPSDPSTWKNHVYGEETNITYKVNLIDNRLEKTTVYRNFNSNPNIGTGNGITTPRDITYPPIIEYGPLTRQLTTREAFLKYPSIGQPILIKGIPGLSPEVIFALSGIEYQLVPDSVSGKNCPIYQPTSKDAVPKSPSPTPPIARLPNPPETIKPMKDCCAKVDDIYKFLGIAKLKKNKFKVAKAFLSPGGIGNQECEDYYDIKQAEFRMWANGLIINPVSKPLGNEWKSVNATAWAQDMYEMMAESMSDGNSSQRYEMASIMHLTQMLSILAELTRKVEFAIDVLGSEPEPEIEYIPSVFTIHESHKGFEKKEPKKIDIGKAKSDDEVEAVLAKMMIPSLIPIVKWKFNPEHISIMEALRGEKF